jgi:parvulin-like peptidyl-prolyl isomerase
MHDPFLRFMMLGAMLFAAISYWQHVNDPRRIVVNSITLEQIAREYRQRFGTTPSPAVLRAAVRDYVEDELLYREALAQGLGADDEIVRRRLVQKMRFLLDVAPASNQPTEADLRDYYQRHASRYAVPERVSFEHIYFSSDRDEGSTLKRAAGARERLLEGGEEFSDPASLGDPFPDNMLFSDVSEADATRIFGRSQLTQELPRLPVGQWSDPLRSGLGVHLVRIINRARAGSLPFKAVRGKVAEDFTRQAADARSRRAIKELAGRYEVVLPQMAGE